MDTKYIHPQYTPSFPLSSFPPLSHWYPTPEKIYFSLLPFIFLIKYILIVQGNFTLVLQVCIYGALNSLPSIIYSFLSPFFPNIQQLTIQYIILYSYTDELFQYFSFSNIFFLSPTSFSPL
jgi:hypothetical protein